MALTIHKNMSIDLLNLILGVKKSSRRTFDFQPSKNPMLFSLSDSFITAGDSILRATIQKMRDAIDRPVTLANGQALGGQNMQLFTAGASVNLISPISFKPTGEQVERAVADAGGREALAPWLVDGMTKLRIDGLATVARVDQALSGNGKSDPKADAASALARFGLSADRLDGDMDALRNDLRAAAAEAGQGSPDAALAIEYALEDAFKKIRALEDSRNGVSPTAYQDQLDINTDQADSLMTQLGLGSGSAWGMGSLAADLAVFGKDMTALANRSGLADELTAIHGQKMADLKNRYTGTEIEYYQEIRRLDGALSRLTTGLQSSASAATAGMSASGSVAVTISGVEIHASSVVSMVNVVSDPLVFDLNGDGIDLKAAEEGVEFDMDGDGEKRRTGFIRGDDALLFLDTHGDGVVHDGRQLFGNADGYANGFEMLRAHDENGDGVIDENDSIYSQLRLWVEKNEDGVCEADETMSLAEAGIKSIRVAYDNVREDDGKGNLIGQKGSFTRTDGSEGLTADVWFRELAEKRNSSTP